ncbi:MAG: phosphoribosylglycinamide formyltransferase [Pseudomonadota bacterium]
MSTPPCRVAILISGSGTNLQSFIDAEARGESAYTVCHVFSNRADAYGLERAQRANVPTDAVAHTEFESRDEFDRTVGDILDAHSPDILVLAGYMRILSAEFVARYAGRILNIHPALLPAYPGLDTHQRVLDAGETHHGSTVHFVTEELDGGPPVLQGRLQIGVNETAGQLMRRVQDIEHRIYPQCTNWFAEGRLEFRHGAAWLDGKQLRRPVVEDF